MAAIRHFVVTLTGSSQPLTTTQGIVGSSVYIQCLASNTHEVFLGGMNSAGIKLVSTTDYGVRLPPPDAAGNPAPPYPLDPWNKLITVQLSDIQVIGTASEKIVVYYLAP